MQMSWLDCKKEQEKVMYRKEIEEYIDSHKDQMIEDICTLCRINSEKMPYTEGKPFGEGPFEVLQTALTMMENYGFSVRNYDNYVGTADLNDKEAQLDILAHLDIVPAGEGWTVTEYSRNATKFSTYRKTAAKIQLFFHSTKFFGIFFIDFLFFL